MQNVHVFASLQRTTSALALDLFYFVYHWLPDRYSYSNMDWKWVFSCFSIEWYDGTAFQLAHKKHATKKKESGKIENWKQTYHVLRLRHPVHVALWLPILLPNQHDNSVHPKRASLQIYGQKQKQIRIGFIFSFWVGCWVGGWNWNSALLLVPTRITQGGKQLTHHRQSVGNVPRIGENSARCASTFALAKQCGTSKSSVLMDCNYITSNQWHEIYKVRKCFVRTNCIPLMVR